MTSRYRRHLLAAVVCLLALAAPAARADRNAYAGLIVLSASSGNLQAVHKHDWRGSTDAAREKMMSTDQNPFGPENTFSTLCVRDSASGTELFRRPVPALTHLWIDPASKYIVGLSKVKLDNPYHLVVFNRQGERLLERSLLRSGWPHASESVSNWIHWYKQPAPKIELVEGKDTAVLSVEDQGGVMRSFAFPMKRPSEALNLGAPVSP